MNDEITLKSFWDKNGIFGQDGQALPGVEPPGELSGWQQQQVEEEKIPQDEIHSNESFLSYSNQVSLYPISSDLLSKWTPLGELKGKLLELQPSRQPHWLKVFVVKIRKENVSAQREDYFNFRDENENFFLSVPCFKTQIRILQLSLVLVRREWEIL